MGVDAAGLDLCHFLFTHSEEGNRSIMRKYLGMIKQSAAENKYWKNMWKT